MRTRAENTLQNFPSSATVVSLNYTGISWRTPGGSWSSGYRLLPGITQSSLSSDNPSNGSTVTQFGRYSQITDELPHKQRIGYVDHIVREILPMKTRRMTSRYTMCTNYTYGTYPWGPYAFTPMGTIWTESYRTQRSAINAAVRRLGSSFNVISTSSLPARVDADSRVVVRKVMDRLVKFNGATYLAEMKDLPQLYRWLVKRRRFAAFIGNTSITDHSGLRRASKLIQLEINRVVRRKGTPFWELTRPNQLRVLHSLAKTHIGDAYLGTIFGLMPTISETRELINELATQRKRRSKFSVTSTLVTRPSTPSIGPFTEDQLYNAVLNDTSYCSSVVGARVEVVHNPYVSSEINNLNTVIDQYLGYNPSRPLWAVIPFSFVVDWFFGVDNMLDAAYLSTTKKLDIQWWKSAKLERSWLLNGQVAANWVGPTKINLDLGTGAEATWIMENCSFSGRYSRYTREAIQQPIESFAPKVPELPHIGKLFTLALIALGLVKR